MKTKINSVADRETENKTNDVNKHFNMYWMHEILIFQLNADPINRNNKKSKHRECIFIVINSSAAHIDAVECVKEKMIEPIGIVWVRARCLSSHFFFLQIRVWIHYIFMRDRIFSHPKHTETCIVRTPALLYTAAKYQQNHRHKPYFIHWWFHSTFILLFF